MGTNAFLAVPRSISTAALRFVLAAVAGLALGCGSQPSQGPVAGSREAAAANDPQIPGLPYAGPHDDYVGSSACRECHAQEFTSWQASYHRTMTQVVRPETVVGDFSDQELQFYGWRFRPERRGDQFWLHVSGSSGSPQFSHQLILATGSHHMQKYWYPTGRGRELGLAPLVYLIEAQQWVPEHTAFLQPTESGLPLREGIWNRGCAQCHATGSQPRVFADRPMDTHVAEFGIACEACHGPAAAHVAATNRAAVNSGRESLLRGAESSASIVNPAKLSAARSAMVCGQCHGAWVRKQTTAKLESRPDWQEFGHKFRPGGDLHEHRHYVVGSGDEHLHGVIQAQDSFWSDGEIRVAGREYNGLLASPCFAHADDSRRMTCTSCHDPHARTWAGAEQFPSQADGGSGTAKTPAFNARASQPDAARAVEPEPQEGAWADDQLASNMRGNDACYQCHPSYRERPTDHTHHAADSAGSLCYDCHMPYTSYGLLKAVRSHTISRPSVATSLQTGRPNACNQCHLDQTLSWTASYLEEWYGQPVPAFTDDQRFIAASILWATQGDAGQRALMAWSMGWAEARRAGGSDWMAFYLTNLMFDDYDAIRYIAFRSLRRIDGFADLQYDHMQPQSLREPVTGEVLKRWQQQVSRRPTDARLLYDQLGNIRLTTYRRLLESRDNRRVVITE